MTQAISNTLHAAAPVPRRRHRSWCGLALVAALALADDAHAQAPNAPPLIRTSVDDLGVDLVSGTLNLSVTDLAIGDPANGGLQLTRSYYLNGWRDNLTGTITTSSSVYTVSIGSASESFTLSGGTYTPAQGQGSSLTYNSGTLTYTYTSSDGAVATFSKGIGAAGAITGAEGFITSLTFPNGRKLSYNYFDATACFGPDCVPSGVVRRLQSVTTNQGYMIHFNYVRNDTFLPLISDLDQWNTRTGAVGLNTAVDYCGELAPTCPTFTVSWPSVSYSGTFTVSETVTNSLSQVTTYSYDSVAHRLTGIRWPSSASNDVVIGYNGSGRVGSVTIGGVGKSYTYSDSGGNRTTTVTDGLSHQRTVVSSLATSLVSSDTNALGKVVSFQYDSQGRNTRITLPEGNYVSHTYDARGNVTETRRVSKTAGSPADIVTSAGFDVTCSNRAKCNKPNYAVDAKGAQTDFSYESFGAVQSVTLPAPAVGAVRPQTRFAYTGLQAYFKNSSGVIAASGTPVQMLTGISQCRTTASCVGGADELKTALTYGTAGVANNLLLTVSTQSDGTGASSRATTVTYDPVGNSSTVDGPLAGDTIKYRYDGLRRRIGVTYPDPDGGGVRVPRAERSSFSSQGRLTSVEEGTVASQSDADWTAFNTLGSVSYEYDSPGRRSTARSVSGGTTYALQQFSYDAASRVDCTAVRMNPAVFGSLPASACTHGAAGGFGPDRITKYGYDAADHVTAVTTGFGTSDAITENSTTYTDNGSVFTLTNGKGYLTKFVYDGHDRLSTTYFPNPSSLGASSTTDFETLGYDANSNVTSVRRRNGGDPVILTPDALNRITVKDLPGTSAEDVYASYDNQNRLLSARFGSTSGSGIIYTYDALGRPQTTTTFGRTVGYVFDAADNRTQVTYPDGYAAIYAYNAAYQLTGVTDSNGLTLATYTYNNLGSRTGYGRGNGASTGYGYDAIGRLASITQDLAGTSHDNTTTFAHNPAFQIATRTQTNDSYSWASYVNGSRTITHNGIDQAAQIVGASAFGYDTNGNMTNDGAGSTYTYDVENKLRTATTTASSATLSYDPSGLLNTLSVPGTSTTFLYDGSALIAEYDSGGNLVRRYVNEPGIDGAIVSFDGASTSSPLWQQTDELGSRVALSDGGGNGTPVSTYSPYGENETDTSSRLRYTGQMALAELGLQYYKARFYNPKLGRFLQPDPAGLRAGMNFYEYVGGDPINRTDPSGMGDVCFDFYWPSTISAEDPYVKVGGYRPQTFCIAFPDLNFSDLNIWGQLGTPTGGPGGTKQDTQQKPTQCLNPDGTVGNDNPGSITKPNVVFAGVDAEGYLIFGGGIHAGGFYDRSTGNFGLFWAFDLGGGLGVNAGGSVGVASQLSAFQGPTSVVGGGVGLVSGNYITQPGSLTRPIGASVGLGVNAMPPLPIPASAHASKSFTQLFATSLPSCKKK